jgi:hypothetical protein
MEWAAVKNADQLGMNGLLVGFAPAIWRDSRHAPTPTKGVGPLLRKGTACTVTYYNQRGTACHSHGDSRCWSWARSLRRRKWITLHTLFFVIRVNGKSSQIACITGRMRHRETPSVLPWTLHTGRVTAKSCFRINSALSGLTERTRIRRIAQTIYAEKTRWEQVFRAVVFEPERPCRPLLGHSGHCARRAPHVMSDRRLYRRYQRQVPQPDVAGVVASALLAVGLIAVPSLIPWSEPTEKSPIPSWPTGVGQSSPVRAPLPKHPRATVTSGATLSFRLRSHNF